MQRSNSSSGYNLVVLAVVITVMTIAVAAAMPSWSTAIQREKEEELIFRGLQMAEGIRIFQRRFGRLPVTLDELAKAEPRSLRQAWKDPMSEDGTWAVVTAQQAGLQPGGAPDRRRGRPESPPGQPAEPAAPTPTGPDGNAPSAVGPDGRPVQGPVAGVRSSTRKRSIKTFRGASDYSAWLFTYDLLQPAAGGGRRGARGLGGPAGATGPAIPNANWVGRPLRHGVEAGAATPRGGSGPASSLSSDPVGQDDDQNDDGDDDDGRR